MVHLFNMLHLPVRYLGNFCYAASLNMRAVSLYSPMYMKKKQYYPIIKVARALTEGGGCLFIYSCYVRLFFSEISCYLG